MNRRDLFKGLGALVSGIALEQAIPLGRVWSFPSQIARLHTAQYSVRYVEAYDIRRGSMVHRIDIGRDRELLIPHQVPRGIAYHNVPANRVLDTLELIRNRAVLPDSEVLAKLIKFPEKHGITGMTWG